MKYVIILVLLADPIYIPFDSTLDCFEQGQEIIETISTYQTEEENLLMDQGWYTPKGKLVYGFYCK